MYPTVQETRPDSQARSTRTSRPNARLQPQLSALLAEVRRARRATERAALALAKAGKREAEADSEADYHERLSRLLDEAITGNTGRRQLVYLACAAEQGVLRLAHLGMGRRTLTQIDTQSDHMALSALYWTTAQRWGRLLPGMAPAPQAPVVPDQTSPRDVCPCDACRALQQDSRRFAPHATLEPASAYPRFNAPGSTAGFRCATCDTHWIRSMLPSEHFAVWSIMHAPAGHGLAGPTPLRPR